MIYLLIDSINVYNIATLCDGDEDGYEFIITIHDNDDLKTPHFHVYNRNLQLIALVEITEDIPTNIYELKLIDAAPEFNDSVKYDLIKWASDTTKTHHIINWKMANGIWKAGNYD